LATDFFTTAAFTGRRLATVRDFRFAFTFFAGAGLAAFRAGAALRFGTGFLFVFATAFGFRFNAAFFLATGLAAFFARLLALLVLGFAADFFLAGALFAPRFGAVFFFVAKANVGISKSRHGPPRSCVASGELLGARGVR
jgi:hypothetical protein